MNRVALLGICLLVSAPIAAQSKRPAPKTTPAPAKSTAAAAPKTAAPKKELAVPFNAGEVLEFDIGWSSYLTAGNATVSVREKKPSFNSDRLLHRRRRAARRRCCRSSTRSITRPTRCSTSTRCCRSADHSTVEEGKRHRMKTTTFDQAAKTANTKCRRHARGEDAHASRVHAGRAVGALRAALDPDEGRRQVQHAGHRRGRRLQGADAGRRGRAVKTGSARSTAQDRPGHHHTKGRRRAASRSGCRTMRRSCR